MPRTLLASGFVAAALTFALIACSGGDDASGGNAGTTPGATPGTPPGSGGAPPGSSDSKFKQCPAEGNTCSEAENKAYADCIASSCDAAWKGCYGDDYRSGNFAGACGEAVKCTQACACGDTSCYAACATKNTNECLECSKGFQTCLSACEAPACAKGGTPPPGTPPPGSSSCPELAACCPTLPSDEQEGCQGVAAAGSSGACTIILGNFKASGKCPG